MTKKMLSEILTNQWKCHDELCQRRQLHQRGHNPKISIQDLSQEKGKAFNGRGEDIAISEARRRNTPPMNTRSITPYQFGRRWENKVCVLCRVTGSKSISWLLEKCKHWNLPKIFSQWEHGTCRRCGLPENSNCGRMKWIVFHTTSLKSRKYSGLSKVKHRMKISSDQKRKSYIWEM